MSASDAKNNKILGKIETEEFKRPDHADFATGAELKARSFSGQRFNGINKDWELWAHGKIVKVVPESTYSTHPEAIPLAYCDYFEMDTQLVEIKGC